MWSRFIESFGWNVDDVISHNINPVCSLFLWKGHQGRDRCQVLSCFLKQPLPTLKRVEVNIVKCEVCEV